MSSSFVGGAFKFVGSVSLAVALSLAATSSAAAQSIEPAERQSAYSVHSAYSDSTLATVRMELPSGATFSQDSWADRVRHLIEPRNSSYDPPVQGGPQSSQGSGTR
jgi:hypothetical protein